GARCFSGITPSQRGAASCRNAPSPKGQKAHFGLDRKYGRYRDGHKSCVCCGRKTTNFSSLRRNCQRQCVATTHRANFAVPASLRAVTVELIKPKGESSWWHS